MTRQAFYKKTEAAQRASSLERSVLAEVAVARELQPSVGARKLLEHIRAPLAAAGLTVGRKKLFDILRRNGLLVKKKKRNAPETTKGDGTSAFEDLRKNMEVTGRDQLWAGDITYIRLEGGTFCYGTFVTDEYTHEIMGFCVTAGMGAREIGEAMDMAVRKALDSGPIAPGLVFHSDRGKQFVSAYFRGRLPEGAVSSTTQDGKGYENPVAERVNGILKEELLSGAPYKDLAHARGQVAEKVHIYNNVRLHMSCGMLTPAQARVATEPLKKHWKNYRKIKKTIE